MGDNRRLVFCQPLSKPLFLWAPGTRLETRVNGFLGYVLPPHWPFPKKIQANLIFGSEELFARRNLFMRCAEGIFAKGILRCTGFSLLRWEKVSETPSCDGEQGLRLPRSLCRTMRNEGVSDPFSRRKRESQTLFPTAKGKTPYIPKSP